MTEACGPSRPPARPIGELFHAHRARVYRWALAHGLTHDQSLDLVQESFTRLLAARPACPSEPAQLAWLRRTLTNLAIDSRRRARPAALADGPSAPGFEPALRIDEDRIRLGAAVASLTEPQRIVLLAKTVDELTFAQIAADHGIAIPTAKTHFARALASLRDAMGVSQGVRS